MGLAQNGMGPAVVTWEALAAWSLHMRVDVEPWEARVLVTLGVMRANIQSEKMKQETKRAGHKDAHRAGR